MTSHGHLVLSSLREMLPTRKKVFLIKQRQKGRGEEEEERGEGRSRHRKLEPWRMW